MRRHWMIGFLPLWAACAESGPEYHRDVRPIIEGRCVSCHADGAIAPFALQSYAEVQSVGPAVAHAVSARLMPPWSAGDSAQFRGDVSLSEAQIQTITEWVELGMPEGNPNDVGPALPVADVPFPGTDLQLELPEPYVPQGRPDDYRCFAIPWPETEEVFVTALNIIPGNIEIVHHAAVFLLPPANAAKPFVWDAEDEAPGYECFGGPSGGRDAIPVSQLGAWLPGQAGNVYPDNIGIRVQPGSTLVLQMHYNVLSFDTEADQSKVLFHLEREVDNEAWYAPFLNSSWVIGQMPIPAGEAEVVHEHQEDPRDFFNVVAGFDLPLERGFNIHAVMFHMHQLGVRGRVMQMKRGRPTPILDIERWDFNWQRQYALQEPMAIDPGDEIRLECVYDNSTANRARSGPPVDANWGEGTADEMCVANFLITAR